MKKTSILFIFGILLVGTLSFSVFGNQVNDSPNLIITPNSISTPYGVQSVNIEKPTQCINYKELNINNE